MVNGLVLISMEIVGRKKDFTMGRRDV